MSGELAAHIILQEIKTSVDDPPIQIGTASETTTDHNEPEYYWAYHKGKLVGPYTPNQLQSLYVRDDIYGTTYVKRCTTNNNKSKWLNVYLPRLDSPVSKRGEKNVKSNANDNNANETKVSKSSNDDSEKLRSKYPNLYKKLLIETKSIRNKLPSIPDDAKTSLSCVNTILHYLGVSAVGFIFVIHRVISIPALVVIAIFQCCIYKKWDMNDRKTKIVAICSISISYLIMPSLLIYLIFFVSNIYNYIQSWMVSIIVWGLFVSITFALEIYFYVIKKNLKLHHKMHYVLFNIAGIEANHELGGQIDTMAHLLACLTPAIIIGYIINFIIQEKFLLECSINTQSSICYKNQCCELVSSHDISNLYSFSGALASNILAAYAFVRIIAWICVQSDLEALATATKKKF